MSDPIKEKHDERSLFNLPVNRDESRESGYTSQSQVLTYPQTAVGDSTYRTESVSRRNRTSHTAVNLGSLDPENSSSEGTCLNSSYEGTSINKRILNHERKKEHKIQIGNINLELNKNGIFIIIYSCSKMKGPKQCTIPMA